jgi:hypothetical protein
LQWDQRAITRLAYPPRDIWTRVWRSATTPKQRDIWYKLLLNAQPLGARVEHFDPDAVHCSVCPRDVQTFEHFIFDCPLAQQVWQDFAFVFCIPYYSISMHNVLFLWPAGPSLFLGRAYGYRLQAGHAVAIHTLWVASCQARYASKPSTRASISARFRSALLRHFDTLRRSPKWQERIGTLPPFFSM